MSAPKHSQIESLQIARFLAALMVVLDHTKLIGGPVASKLGLPFYFPQIDGRFGVDIFFIISGFIMVHISSERDRWTQSPMSFAINRFARIVPVYYIATLLYVLLFLGAAISHGHSSDLRWTFIEYVQSFLFLPYFDHATRMPQPVLSQGWTLNYEIFFYALFALALLVQRRKGLVLLLLGFVVLVATGEAWTIVVGRPFSLTPVMDTGSPDWIIPRFWLHPIILEFAAGIILAIFRQKLIEGRRLPPFRLGLPAIFSLACIYNLAFVLGYSSESEIDCIRPGFALAIVSIAVLTQNSVRPSRLTVVAVALGDASYALYLFHVHALFITSSFWTRWGSFAGMEGFVAMAVAGSVGLSYLVYRHIEIPLRVRARNILVGPKPSAPMDSFRAAAE